MPRDQIESMTAEYRRYKQLGEGAFAQLGNGELCQAASADDNSVAALVWHVAGNLKSRFTDFQTSDGEKPWRNRDEEFDARRVSREALLEKWEAGWGVLLAALSALDDADLGRTIAIRGQALRVDEALHRSLAHTTYHCGQIVLLAKNARGAGWRSLSIPRGQSSAFNRNPVGQLPDEHARVLGKGDR